MTAFLKEMRAAVPDKYISVASPAAEYNWINQGVSAEQAKYVVHYRITDYDYVASDIPNKQPMCPNQNLFNVPLPVERWSTNYAMQGFLAAGVTSAAA